MSLNVNGLQQAESKRYVYRITATADWTPEALLDPAFWVHVSRTLRVDDRIEVIAHDRSWFGEVTVLEVGVGGLGGARVAYIIGPVELQNAAVVLKPAEFEPRWGGPNAKWQVVRVKDCLVLKSGLETKEEAGALIGIMTPVAA